MKTKTRIVGMNRIVNSSMTHHNCGSVYFVNCENQVGSIFFSGSMHGTGDNIRCLASLGVCWRDRKGEVQSLDVRKRGDKTAQAVFETKDGPVEMTVRNGRLFFRMPQGFVFTHTEAWDMCH